MCSGGICGLHGLLRDRKKVHVLTNFMAVKLSGVSVDVTLRGRDAHSNYLIYHICQCEYYRTVSVESYATTYLFLYSQQMRLSAICCVHNFCNSLQFLTILTNDCTILYRVTSSLLLYTNSLLYSTTMSRMSVVSFGRTIYAFTKVCAMESKNSVLFRKTTGKIYPFGNGDANM